MSELWNAKPDDYGPDFQSHLLEQYKIFVEMADRISQRRTAANNYLLTVNAFLVTLFGLANSITDPNQKGFWVYLVPIAGILVSLTWLWIIQSYRAINTAKFKVVHLLEERLPARIYAHEWDLAEKGEGRAYWAISHVEQLVPWVFMGLYFTLAAFAIWQQVCANSLR